MSTRNVIFTVALLLAGGVIDAQADCQIVGNERQCSDPFGNEAWTAQVGANEFNRTGGEFAAVPRTRPQAAPTFSNGDFSTAGQIGSQDFKAFRSEMPVTE